MGEVLVGSGVWANEQLNIVGIGSIDLSQFGGPILNGYVDGNNIVYKIWKAEENVEYDAEVSYEAGTGTWGEILTVVSNLEPIFSVEQILEFDPYRFNLASLNVSLEENSISTIFGDLDLLLVSNDQSDYYVPSYSVDQIGSLLEDQGYNVFLNGGNSQSLMVEGLPVDAGQMLSLDAFRMNLLPYLPSACMPPAEVFAGYEESLLIVKNDDSDYFVPAYGVMTLSELCPGEAYGVFLSGTSGIDFMYPMGGGLSSNHNGQIVENYKSRAHVDVLPETGESALIIVTDVIGDLNMGVGDQIRAYANNNLVSAINIVQEHVDGTILIALTNLLLAYALI
jgi:hypothetical protein